MDTHWMSTQRIMGEVLMRDEQPRNIWDQHEAMLEAIASGDAGKAEELGRQHISQAADFMIRRLQESGVGDKADEAAP
jgi:DNA-binding GntR family transcriptional regulator